MRRLSMFLSLATATLWCHGQPSFTPVISPAVPHLRLAAMDFADYDNDGDPDLYISGIDSTGALAGGLYYLDGNLLLPDTTQTIRLVSQGAAAWGDYDGDNDPDLFVCGDKGGGYPFSILYENVGGTLQPSGIDIPALMHGDAHWHDLDNDADLDLLVLGFSKVEGQIGLVVRNMGGGQLAPLRMDFLDGLSMARAAVGDIDGDGLPDLMLSGAKASGALAETRLLRNLGSMRFGSASHTLPSFSGAGLSIADLDGDGKGDALGCGEAPGPVSGVWSWSGGQLGSTPWAIAGVAMGDAAAHDFDGDGDQDAVLCGRTATGDATLALRNTGTSFTQVQAASQLPALYQVRVAWTDWNTDGNADFLVAGQDGLDRPFAYILTYDTNTQTFKF